MVIGGGIIGNSVAYHLAKMGMKDVVLLEQQQVTAGTTWHAAGLMVTFGSMNETSTDMRKYTRKLYSELEAETGQATGFKPVGKFLLLQLKLCQQLMLMLYIFQVSLSSLPMLTVLKNIAESLLSIASTVWMFTKSLLRKCRSYFLFAVSVKITQKLTNLCLNSQSSTFVNVPPTGVDDIQAGFYVKEDGRVNPVDVTMALAKGTD